MNAPAVLPTAEEARQQEGFIIGPIDIVISIVTPTLRKAVSDQLRPLWKGKPCYHQHVDGQGTPITIMAEEFGHWPDTVGVIIQRLCEPYHVGGGLYRVPFKELKERWKAKHRPYVAHEVGRGVCKVCNAQDRERILERYRLEARSV